MFHRSRGPRVALNISRSTRALPAISVMAVPRADIARRVSSQ
jgi:hypothetical protein